MPEIKFIDRSIYPVEDEKIPELIDNLRRHSGRDWTLIAADTLEAMWLRFHGPLREAMLRDEQDRAEEKP